MMKQLAKWFLSLVLAVILLLTAAYFFAPWQPYVENQLKAKLEQAGITPVAFEVESLGLHGVVLKNVSVFSPPLQFEKLEINYNLQAIAQNKAAFIIRLAPLNYEKNPTSLNVGEIILQLSQGQTRQEWAGTWAAKNIAVTQGELPIPTLQGQGTLGFAAGALNVEGGVMSDDKTHSLDFSLAKAPNENGSLLVKNFTAPWQGGEISSQNITVDLGFKKPISFALNVKKVPLGVLLAMATGDKVEATGSLSGKLPITIKPDGKFIVHDAKLTTPEHGTIKLSQGAIPEGQTELALVKDVLANFNYENIALTADSGKDEQLSMLLSLSGHNPDVYNGREVKLNVRLSGDLLSVLQQSILPLNDPQKYLEQTK